MNFDFSMAQVLNFLYMIFVLLVSLSVHESAHAFAAEKRGDPTGRMLGRITLNPIKHLDPFGSVLVPAVMFLLTQGNNVFGWAKPVPVNTRNFKNLRVDNALVAAAGPVSNFALALAATLVMCVYLLLTGSSRFFAELGQNYSPPQLMLMFASVNLLLMAFNFIPVPPLDGSHVLEAFIPQGPLLEAYDKVKPFGFLVLLFLLLTPLLGAFLKLVMSAALGIFVFFPLSLVSAIAGK